MSYEVTATRRRPQAFDALAGQEFVAETLKNAIQSQKIAHAYLFSGPRGCGKTSTARILSKALNCAEGPTATPCGKCQQCLEITRGSSTDVIEIDGASNTSVNDVRQIKDEVMFPPQSSRYKIYIIDEVHMLSTSAFNALLKTIEEPPSYCIFIFATTELQKVPATIKSRCQQFNFRLVPIERIKQLLAEAAAEINIKADDEALYWVARESTGSVRDAYTLFDQVAAFSGDHITYEKIRDKLGLVGVDRLNVIFEAAAQNKSQEALLKIDDFLQNGVSIEQFIVNCTDYLRSLLLIRAGITKEALLGQSVERFSKIVLQSWNPVQLERALSILLQLYRDIRYSLSPRYELELAFSRLSWLNQYVSPAEVKKAIDDAKNLLAQAQNLSPQAAGQAPQKSMPQPVSQKTGETSSNPYLNRIITEVPERETSSREKPDSPSPRNIFAPPPHQEEQSFQEINEDFSPPDPTPPDSQSFSTGGAVPPEQTAGPVQDPQNNSDFRALAIKELTMKEPMIGSSLLQTGTWIKNGSTVTTQVASAYLKMQLDSHRASITSLLSQLCGEKIQFEVMLKQNVSSPPVESTAPVQVKLLCDIFKGQITGHSKKSKQEIAAEKEKQTNEHKLDSDDENILENTDEENE